MSNDRFTQRTNTMLDLSGAYILDPQAGMGMAVDHQHMAQAIAERYPNIRLAQVPAHYRTSAEEFPFALVDFRTGDVVKPLREREMTIRFIFEWLYKHDLQARGVKEVWDNYMREKERLKKEHMAPIKERQAENLDIVHSMAKSPLHTYKHGNRKVS
jgi:hypothetical protein